MLVESVKAREKEMRNARAIIIDTRGNFGGTTIWATKLAEAIFTPRVLNAAQPRQERDRRVASDLRSSPENITYLRNFVAGLQGSDVEQARRTFNQRLKEIERAAKRSPPLCACGLQEGHPRRWNDHAAAARCRIAIPGAGAISCRMAPAPPPA